MIHKKVGFSVPFYLSHELVGFIFIGQKSKYSIFSSTEIRLVPPVARIIMESAMVVELNKKNRYVSDMQNRIVFSFADMIESRDGLTGQHVKRTSQIVILIMNSIRGTNMFEDELEPLDYEMIAMAAPLHDIGKIKVPDAILSKPGKLTEEEFAIIKTHPVEGERIISKTMAKIENEKYLKFAKDMALYHHEKWNGTGYPYGLSGKEIPLCARIMAVADVFDALCSERSYKEAYSIDKAFEIFEE
jgi:HD-GYP domain-containing protein (c-di-GMP phosphodiesterase class II)